MSLDIYLFATDLDGNKIMVYDANITHNLAQMADEAGIYKLLWRAPENNYIYARQIKDELSAGIERMRANPKDYLKHNPSNGWGSYDGFISWLDDLLEACVKFPSAQIETSR